jgi:hypothetical protein
MPGEVQRVAELILKTEATSISIKLLFDDDLPVLNDSEHHLRFRASF